MKTKDSSLTPSPMIRVMNIPFQGMATGGNKARSRRLPHTRTVVFRVHSSGYCFNANMEQHRKQSNPHCIIYLWAQASEGASHRRRILIVAAFSARVGESSHEMLTNSRLKAVSKPSHQVSVEIVACLYELDRA